MRLFCRILGQTAGDLALVAGAQGGVYLAGGIPPRILPLLADGEFLAGFRAKGRFAAWTAAVPVRVVLDPDVGLKGAALAA
jgi:glucokinase